MADRQRRGNGLTSTSFSLVCLLLGSCFLTACFPARAKFSPPPAQINSVEGYASLRLTRQGETAKSRFSFLFLLPDQGRIELFHPLGGTVSLLFLEKEAAFFVLPGKHLYWRADREEVMARFLGFALSPKEIVDLLSGKADVAGGWDLEQDSQGRTVRGRRAGLEFEVRQFYGQTSLPRILSLTREEEKSSLKILSLAFNRPWKKDAFRLSFLEDNAFRPVSWDEMEKCLKDMMGR